MNDLHADLTALVNNTSRHLVRWIDGSHLVDVADLSALLAAHTPPSEPVAEPSHQQRADHFQHLYEQASEGRCGHSGLTIGACKASICDCFEFPWVDPAPEEHPDRADRVDAAGAGEG